MKYLALLLVLCCASFADCPTYSECPIDGVAGNPTGRYRDQGARHFAEFSHLSHRWWELCK